MIYISETRPSPITTFEKYAVVKSQESNYAMHWNLDIYDFSGGFYLLRIFNKVFTKFD